MVRRFAPIGLMLAVACGGAGDRTGPGTVPSDISTMNVGEVRVLTPVNIQNGIDLPSVSSKRDFVIIVGNTSSEHDVVANYVVKGDQATSGSFGISSSPDLSAQSSLQLGQIPPARTPQEAIDSKVRAFERSNLTLRSQSGGPFGSRLSLRRSAQVSAASVPAVGDILNLKIPNAATTDLCNNYIQTQATVASVSRRAILAVDTLDGPPAALFTQAQMDSLTAEFDNITYPTDSSYYNNPTDIDGNSRIIILFSGQINKLTPAGQASFVGGFFFAGDFYPPTNQSGVAGSSCAQSNQAEIFYLLSPDPTGRFGNVRTTSSVRQGTRGTIAHEFQHMINAGHRLEDGIATDFEATWLDEALAHFAEDAVGRVQGGFTDLQTLTYSDIHPCDVPCQKANDYNAFFYQNLARLTYWMASPDKYSPTSRLADTSLATRGAAWAIVRYVADNFSNGDPRAFTRKLALGPDTGVKNFAAVAGSPIDTLVSGWLVSMYADHQNISGLNAKYQYRSYNFFDVMPPVAQGVLNTSSQTYPLLVNLIGSGSSISAMNRSGTGTYYRLTVPANSAEKVVKILDSSGNLASFAGEHVYILRIQ